MVCVRRSLRYQGIEDYSDFYVITDTATTAASPSAPGDSASAVKAKKRRMTEKTTWRFDTKNNKQANAVPSVA